MFHFWGQLMGVCIHTCTNISVPLPSIVWKQLVGQRLQMEDIEEFDDGIITELKQILESENPDDFLSADQKEARDEKERGDAEPTEYK